MDNIQPRSLNELILTLKKFNSTHLIFAGFTPRASSHASYIKQKV